MDTIPNDEYIRKEFARAFGWWKNYSGYGENSPRTPTWEEIFIEVGKLLNRSQTLTDTHQLNSIERRMDDLETYLNSKKDQLL